MSTRHEQDIRTLKTYMLRCMVPLISSGHLCPNVNSTFKAALINILYKKMYQTTLCNLTVVACSASTQRIITDCHSSQRYRAF